MLRNLGPFAKPEHGVFSLPSHVKGVSQKWNRSLSLGTVRRRSQPRYSGCATRGTCSTSDIRSGVTTIRVSQNVMVNWGTEVSIPYGSLKKRFPPSSPNDSGERSVGKIRQDNMALQMNATFLEVIQEVLSGLLITKSNVEGSKRIRGRRWPRTLKRIPSRHGFTRFGCHSAIYPREWERDRAEHNHNTETKNRKKMKQCMHEKCMNIWRAKFKSIIGKNLIQTYQHIIKNNQSHI